jgi:hypothetical protein
VPVVNIGSDEHPVLTEAAALAERSVRSATRHSRSSVIQFDVPNAVKRCFDFTLFLVRSIKGAEQPAFGRDRRTKEVAVTKTVHNCIWCKRPVRRQNIEHILPDSLGCPSHFVLKDCVCISCNNGLGHVDQALLRDFEIIAFTLGVRRKGGRPPSINNWRGIRGRYGANGPEMCLNAGPQTVQAFGQNLHAASPRHGIQDISVGPLQIGQRSEIKFEQQFGKDPKFRRAVHKVALGALAYFRGAVEALRDAYDPARAFVRKDVGDFDVLMMGGSADQNHCFYPPAVLPGCSLPVVEMAIFGVSFAVDLDPNQRGLDLMRERLTARQVQNWMVLPRAA